MTTFLDTPVNKSLSATGAWTDIDLSSDVPASAMGAIFRVVIESSSAKRYGFRKKGSTDGRYSDLYAYSQSFAVVGLDSNRKCQGEIETTDVDFFLIGYTEGDATLFTNATNKSLGATGSWIDIDLSSNIPAGSVAAIFEVISTDSFSREFGLRKKGSTDNRYGDIRGESHSYMIVGVDANRKCQGRIESTDVDFYLLGYLTSGQAETNAHNRSLGSTGSYIDIDESANAPSGATGIFGELTSTAAYNFAARKNGTSFDYYEDCTTHDSIMAGLDANRKLEGKIENVAVDFFTMGYFAVGVETITKSSTIGLSIKGYGAMGCVMTYEVSGPTYNDQTTAANNATINDVQPMFDGAGDILYYGDNATYAGVKIKYSTKGVIGSAVIVMEYSKGSSVWGTLSCTDESNKFTEDPGTYLLSFTPPGDWATDTVDGKTHYWIRHRLTSSSYTTNPQLDQLWVIQTNTKSSTIGLSIEETNTKSSTLGVRLITQHTKASSMGLKLITQPTKASTLGMSLTGPVEKSSSLGISIEDTFTKASSLGLRLVTQHTKASSLGMKLITQHIKESSLGLVLSQTVTKASSLGLTIVETVTKESSLGICLIEQAEERGFYYAKLGSTILSGIRKDNFRITEEIDKIPSFEIDIANCSDNRTTIVAGITDVLTIYRRINDVDVLMFTGIINADTIEYLSLERIRLTGYASYIDLNWRFHQHLNSEDVETVDKVYNYTGSYSDKTTEANNDTTNDVPITWNTIDNALYIGQGETFFGMQVKYSTAGVAADCFIRRQRGVGCQQIRFFPECEDTSWATVVFEYSKGSGVWATLDVLDETRAFTEDPGTYFITIPHKPSDWAKDTVNSVKKFWIRARLSDGFYTDQPMLDRIKLTNTDVYRVYYFETAANSIMDDVLAGTDYSMDAVDVCPSDAISVVAEYETKLRFIAGIANALTWDDSGDKKAYQWWIDTSKKVHFKQKRGDTLGDITSELTILNNVEDYFNLSNRLHFLGNYDGLNQLRAVIEDTSSQDTHEIRELAIPEERYNNYTPLKEAAQKAMTYTKAPLQKIAATVTTKYWLDQAFEVGDTVTLHKDTWNVDSTAFQIVRADIGPRVTKLDMGISQEHLDGLKAGLQRQLDITGIRMHGSTTLLQFGPETMNYQRVNDSTVYPSKLKIEIPSDVRYIHKVLLSWTIGPYRASVEPDTGSTSGHDHTGYTGSSSAHNHTGYTGAGGAHTPTELGEGEHTHTDAGYNTYSTLEGYLLSTKYTHYESAHTHPKGSTGGPDDVEDAFTALGTGSSCSIGICINPATSVLDGFAKDTHYHLNTGLSTGVGTVHRHSYPLASGTAFKYVRDPVTTYVVLDTDLDHIHTHSLIVAHNDHLVSSQAGESLTVPTEPGESVTVEYGIHEIAAGTTLELLVNSEVVASSYVGDQTDIVITGFLNTGNNTVEIRPIVGENAKKGSCTILAAGIFFIEAKKF